MAADEDVKREGLDWAAAYARLERLAVHTGNSPEREAAVLEERALSLCHVLEHQEQTGPRLELVHFRSAEQDYALETRFVREVLRSSEQRVPLPGAPEVLRGVVLLHGEVLAVVELAPLFGAPASTLHGPVLVVGQGRPELGVRADRVEEVFATSREALLPPPSALGAQERTLVAGITRSGIIVLEGEALLRDGRLFFDLAEERVP